MPRRNLYTYLSIMLAYPATLALCKVFGLLPEISWQRIAAAPLLVILSLGVLLLIFMAFGLPSIYIQKLMEARVQNRDREWTENMNRELVTELLNPDAPVFSVDLAAHAQDQFLLHILAAAHPSSSPGARELLLGHPEPEVRAALALHPQITPQQAEALAHDLDERVRGYAVLHPKLSEETRENLLQDTPTRRMYALHGKDHHVLKRMSEEAETELSESLALACNPHNYAGLLPLARHRSPFVRREVALNRNTHSSVLGVLVHDSDKETRMLAAMHPRTLEEDRDTVMEGLTPKEQEVVRLTQKEA